MFKNNYQRLSVMLVVSLFIMYSVMFLNVFSVEHIRLSVTQLYLSLLMVTPMAITMILIMPKMFMNKKANALILGGSVLIFILLVVLLRTQTPIGDEQYMQRMIPHHSSAILTSEQANIRDPEVRKLADEIIITQKEEIAQMKEILQRMENE